MRKFLRKMALLSLVLTGLCSGASAQDLSINSTTSPCAGPLTSQPVKFSVHNYGPGEVTKFTAGIIENGVKLCEKDFEVTIPNMGNYDVELPIRVQTEFGKDYAYKLYVSSLGDTNFDDDTVKVEFTMPTPLAFPYTWNENSGANDFKCNLNYSYDESSDLFFIGGRKTNWRGSVNTKPIQFPAGSKVTCSFKEYNSPTVTLTAVLDYGDRRDTVYEATLDEVAELTEHQFTFTADSTAQVVFYSKMQGGFSTYGTLYFGDISFEEATPDLSVSKLLAPCVNRLVQREEGYAVTARYDNKSEFDITNPTLGFTYGAMKIQETYDGTIKAGESIDYTFATNLDAAYLKTDQLTVWCKADGDVKTENDTLKAEVMIYAVQQFPYTTTFDEGNDLWSQYNGNGDSYVWGLTSEEGWGNIAFFPSAPLGSDDWLFAPAVAMPEGKSRLSFYYTGGLMKSQHLRVLMGTEPSPEKMTTVLFDSDVTNNGWLNGYALIDMPEAATRYFAFQTTGKSDQIVIDNISIDRAEDLCINDVAFDTTTGFERTTSAVTISYVNHGLTPQKDITVKYFLDSKSNPYVAGAEAYAEEVVKATVNPGDTIYYTFAKPADISATEETYSLMGVIATKVGADQRNDSIVGTSIENWAAKTVPYKQTFDDNTVASKQWTFLTSDGGTNNHKWLVGYSASSSYSGTYTLAHQYAVAEDSEDWAISEPIRLKKGSYELSFFYRSDRNWDTDTYKQSFRAALGTAATAEAMTTPVFELKDFAIKGNRSKKLNKIIDIAEDGLYYIGFANTLSGKSGHTYIDDVEINEVADGQALPFESDFAAADSVFTKYYPMKILTGWELVEDADGNKVEEVERNSMDNIYNNGSEGHLVTPRLQLEPNRTVKVTVDYSLTSSSHSDLVINVSGAAVNNPDSLAVLGTLPVTTDGAYTEATVMFDTPAETTPYYIGLRTNTPEEGSDLSKAKYIYTAHVRSIKVEYVASTGINEVTDNDAAIAVIGGKVAISAPAGSVLTIADISGRTVATIPANGETISYDASALRGVYIFKVATPNGTAVKKLTF